MTNRSHVTLYTNSDAAVVPNSEHEVPQGVPKVGAIDTLEVTNAY